MDVKEFELENFKGKSTKRDGWFEFNDNSLTFESGLGLTTKDTMMLAVVVLRLAYVKALTHIATDDEDIKRDLKEKTLDLIVGALDDFDEWSEEYFEEASLAELFQCGETVSKDGDEEIKCVAIGYDEDVPTWLPKEVREAIEKAKAKHKGGELN